MDQWFAEHFPVAERRFGPPTLPVWRPNHDALAFALHEGPARLVFAGAEGVFYFYDPSVRAFRAVDPEARVQCLARALVRLGSRRLPRTEAAQVAAMWTEAELGVVVERARALLTITPDFFSGRGGARRIVGTRIVEPQEAESPALFAERAVEPSERAVLTFPDAYRGYWDFCAAVESAPLRRTAFRAAFSRESLDRWGIGMRHDLVVTAPEGNGSRICQGWRGLALRAIERAV